MTQSIDVLASAIHDAKNQIFFANTLVASTAETHGIDLDPVREAMDRAASRLTRALLAYRLESGGLPLSISAVSVPGLLEDAVSICGAQYEHRGLSVEIRCAEEGIWPLDRDLVLDVISNGLENAARYAAARVILGTAREEEFLVIRIEDDGPGYGATEETSGSQHGLGLHIGRQIALLHQRHGRTGELRQYNGSYWGGAVLELRLP